MRREPELSGSSGPLRVLEAGDVCGAAGREPVLLGGGVDGTEGNGHFHSQKPYGFDLLLELGKLCFYFFIVHIQCVHSINVFS